MAQSITLSSAGTAAIVLNPVVKSTTVLLSASLASSLTSVSIEVSLDDPTIPGGPTTTWALLSSAQGMVGSSVIALTAIYTVLSPVGQVRLNSTTNAGSTAVFTLKALQSITA